MTENRKRTSSGYFSDSEALPSPLIPKKRLRVSDIHTFAGRYQTEFLELAELASGQFGTVKLVRHRLDGMVYVVKVSQANLEKLGSGHQERMTMNEVFAHAAMMKHKHVVRYYTSWVEGGQVYIQNEFCDGGSLAEKIKQLRSSGERLTEDQLKQILVDVLKGLQYIHSKQLAHLDIKPDNIFISREEESRSPFRTAEPPLSSDSGAGSGESKTREYTGSVRYKIGDLGHVTPLHGEDLDPEEGDCRYMAPEFMEMDVDRAGLTKADIFSLGLTIYEAASLQPLPRNSFEDEQYSELKAGKLPYLPHYSERLNNLLSWMVRPDPHLRPSAERLIASLTARPKSSRRQLSRELRRTKQKLERLERLMAQQQFSSVLD